MNPAPGRSHFSSIRLKRGLRWGSKKTNCTMWICTQHGFVSIVCKPSAQGQLGRPFQARFRCLQDARNFSKLPQMPNDRIVTTPDGDYGWRIHLSPEELSVLFEFLAKSIDYSNFKSRVSRRPDQAQKSEVYGNFWADMLRFQDAQLSDSREMPRE